MTIFLNLADSIDAPPTARVIDAHLRAAVTDGALAPGTRLPPIREAAWQLRCAPGTVARAYKALVLAGLAHGEVGRGTFIGGSDPRIAFPPGLSGEARADRASADAVPAPTVDLAINSFGMEDPGALVAGGLAHAAEVLGQGAPAGYRPAGGGSGEREAVLPFLARWRDGLEPGNVVITGGTQSALFAALLALRDQGGGLACDQLTYPGVIAAAAAIGLRLHAVVADGEGMSPDALDALAARVPLAGVFVMPGIHNPTGRVMGARRRAALAEIAARRGLTVVEDQVYGFLLDADGPGFSHLVPERTVLVTGLSKCVSPILRVGYAAASPLLARRILAVQNAMQLMVSPVLTEAASWILGGPGLEARIARLRAGVARRGARAAALLPGVDPVRLSGGLAWMEPGSGWRAEEFAAEALRLGVRVSPARPFAVDPRGAPEAVRLCLACEPDETRFETALETLAGLAGQSFPAAAMLP
ncbi:PLP-dependent aminotransferase family protein [Stappia sp.]|uniref:aminotransferase-like domain-containing protein n=1 Tax=Stappia sp. TaxID=1870903 RepID=UPI003A992F25